MKNLKRGLVKHLKVMRLMVLVLSSCLLLTAQNWIISLWFVILAVIAYEDIKHKSFPVVYGLFFIIYSILIRWGDLFSLTGTIVLGSSLLVLGTARLMKNHIGMGDVLVLMSIMVWTSLLDLAGIVFIASALALVFRVLSKVNLVKNETETVRTIAFIPFLCVGSFFVLILFQ